VTDPKVNDYLQQLHDPLHFELINYFHEKLTLDYGLRSKLRYAIPFYDKNHWIVYLNPVKKKGIELCFLKGREMFDTMHLLNFKERTMVAGLEFLEPKINFAFEDCMEEALRLDAEYKKRR